jgi:hypothetical protein
MRMSIKNKQRKSLKEAFFWIYTTYNKLEIQPYYEFHK